MFHHPQRNLVLICPLHVATQLVKFWNPRLYLKSSETTSLGVDRNTCVFNKLLQMLWGNRNSWQPHQLIVILLSLDLFHFVSRCILEVHKHLILHGETKLAPPSSTAWPQRLIFQCLVCDGFPQLMLSEGPMKTHIDLKGEKILLKNTNKPFNRST